MGFVPKINLIVFIFVNKYYDIYILLGGLMNPQRTTLECHLRLQGKYQHVVISFIGNGCCVE